MPLVKIIGPYEFRFYSRGEVTEPPHIHVRRGKLVAKFWLAEPIRLARAGRFREHELNDIRGMIQEHRQEFIEAWNEYFE